MSDKLDLDQKIPFLGGLSPNEFMAQYWQKKPMLIREAIKDFKPPFTIGQLLEWNKEQDFAVRLIRRDQDDWSMDESPAVIPDLDVPNWTLLLEGVDLYKAEVAALAEYCRFLPYARYDNILISIASEGGGVGPHIDSYDVFLLQAQGQRQWEISHQADQRYRENLPCRILQNFQPEQSFVLNPGDMLYLPPDWAHNGVSLSKDCVTISIGFRTIRKDVMLRGLLEAAVDVIGAANGFPSGYYSEPRLPGYEVSGFYRDPQQKATNHPAEIPEQLVKETLAMLRQLPEDEHLAARFLGCHLSSFGDMSEYFEHEPAQDEPEFDEFDPQDLLVLDHKTTMLYFREALFVNGETIDLQSALLKRLADDRSISVADARAASEDEQSILYQFMDDGWLHVKSRS